MAQQVFVVNEGTDYRDTYREKPIFIPAGGKIKMQRRDAIAFLGRMSPPGPDGKPLPKMLKLVPVDGSVDDEKPKFVCQYDGKEFDTQTELNAYLKTLAKKTVTKEQLEAAKKEE